jgi:DNA-binding Xre family transcriptional regulator
MAVSYNKLWKLLIDKKMSKAEMRRAAGISPNTLTKLNRDEEVTMTIINKICTALQVDVGEVMEFLPDSATSEKE